MRRRRRAGLVSVRRAAARLARSGRHSSISQPTNERRPIAVGRSRRAGLKYAKYAARPSAKRQPRSGAKGMHRQRRRRRRRRLKFCDWRQPGRVVVAGRLFNVRKKVDTRASNLFCAARKSGGGGDDDNDDAAADDDDTFASSLVSAGAGGRRGRRRVAGQRRCRPGGERGRRQTDAAPERWTVKRANQLCPPLASTCLLCARARVSLICPLPARWSRL